MLGKKWKQVIWDLHKQHVLTGLLLMLAAFFAMLMTNLGYADLYHSIQYLYLKLSIGPVVFADSLYHFINDVLMVVFFFLIGLELKKEIMFGHMQSLKQVLLPLFCALGGMLVPSLIYIAFNYDTPAIAAWGVPIATDIAFALGILSLMNGRYPKVLMVFLMALAVFDDLGAIVVIGLFYSKAIKVYALLSAGAVLSALAWLNYQDIRSKFPYVGLTIMLWWFVSHSGVHSTIAGVAAAIFFPSQLSNTDGCIGQQSPGEGLDQIIDDLYPYVNYMILPLFAFVNAGLDLSVLNMNELTNPVVLGVMLGLLVGKPVGVMCFAWLAQVMKIAKLPKDVNYRHILGVACLCGIGFTMSLFIGDLSFDDALSLQYDTYVKLGIILGTLSSGILGCLIIWGEHKK